MSLILVSVLMVVVPVAVMLPLVVVGLWFRALKERDLEVGVGAWLATAGLLGFIGLILPH